MNLSGIAQMRTMLSCPCIPGRSSAKSSQSSLYQSFSDRPSIRLIMTAEIVKSKDVEVGKGVCIADVLHFDRLSEYFQESASVLPVCLESEKIDGNAVRWKSADGEVKAISGFRRLWKVPECEALFESVVIDVGDKVKLGGLVHALDDLHKGKVILGENAKVWGVRKVPRNTHRMVIFSSVRKKEPKFDELQRLVYRADLEANEEFVSFKRPAEMNRRPGRGAVLGPRASVIWGMQDYIENTSFCSTLIAQSAVSTVSTLRREVFSLFEKVAGLDDSVSIMKDISEQQRALDNINNRVIQMQGILAKSIDGLSTLTSYIPSMRVEGYHRALFEAIDADVNRESLERLLSRLLELVRIKQDVLASRRQVILSSRSQRWSVSVGLASVIAIPLSIIFGFFGMSSSEINESLSIFSGNYVSLYLLIIGLTIVIVGVHFIQFICSLRRLKKGVGLP